MCANPKTQRLVVGIDVGGTNTDGVLYDAGNDEIQSTVKIPTDHSDYGSCVGDALRAVTKCAKPNEIISLNISTTLATNAILEGNGAPIALVLIGFGDFPHIEREVLAAVKPAALLRCSGGHNGWGRERNHLDEEALARFAFNNSGAYFAVSSYYSPRNPEHELRAAEIIRTAGCAGVTCGHEIAHSKLNSVKRTVTAALNASLIDKTTKLIEAAERCAIENGLDCPVMFLRSDSSLVSGEWCARFPIETLFSGPAASMRGAALLGAQYAAEALVADMGGTSTDVGRLKDGAAIQSPDGARIGCYRTMIPSVAIHSIALGGDSLVSFDDEIHIGPARVVPFCRSESGAYTLTDALCTLGLANIGDAARSIAASEEAGANAGISGTEFALQVRKEAASRLDALLTEEGDRKQVICVGAPIGAVAPSDSAAYVVPAGGAVASAIGAAISSLSLSCTASIVHSFADGTCTAFLPDGRIVGNNMEELAETGRWRLTKYLKRKAELMGFTEIRIVFEEATESLGAPGAPKNILEIRLTGRVVCA